MATAAQLAELDAGLAALAATVTAIETDEQLRAELDGVNEALDLARGEAGIVLAIANDTSRTAQQRIDLILQAMGPQ